MVTSEAPAESQLGSQAAWLRAISHPTRLEILLELTKGHKCVSDLEHLLPASQPNISQHLAILRHAGLVTFCQEGPLRCYYIARPSLVMPLLELLARDHPVIKKSKEELRAETGNGRRTGKKTTLRSIIAPARASRT